MAEFQYEVIHRPGKQHSNADSLSRGQCRQCGLEVELETEMFPVCEIPCCQLGQTKRWQTFRKQIGTYSKLLPGCSLVQYPNDVQRIRLGNSNPSGLSAKTCC